MLEHVKGALDSKESIRLLLLAKPIEEYGQVVMVIELFHINLPLDAIANASVFNRDGKVSTLVEPTEFRVGGVLPHLVRSRHRRFDWAHFFLPDCQAGAGSPRRILMGRVSRALEVVRPRHLRSVAELGSGIIVMRIVRRIWHPWRPMTTRANGWCDRPSLVKAAKGLKMPISASLEHRIASEMRLNVIFYHGLIGSVAVVEGRKRHCDK
mmetsp:Transcript_37277/g.76399  ORF Transcript_37277/g.76399 Transcript_37277/m.76399 type:complete len:210 (+) Transcript_37277:527-1156(+)